MNVIIEVRDLFLDSLKVQQKEGSKQGMVECLVGLAETAVVIGRLEIAAQFFGATEGLLGSFRAMITPEDRLVWECHQNSLCAQLHQDVLERAWKLGKTTALNRLLNEMMTII